MNVTRKRGRPPLSDEEKARRVAERLSEKMARGRPPKPEAEVKREQMSFRVTPARRDQLVAAAEATGRSIAQEVELRLEQSFAREKEAGSRSAAILSDFTRLSASAIEAQTGASWLEDPDTFLQVRRAVLSFMRTFQPSTPQWVQAAMDAQEELALAQKRLDAVRRDVLGLPPAGEAQNALLYSAPTSAGFKAGSLGHLLAQQGGKLDAPEYVEALDNFTAKAVAYDKALADYTAAAKRNDDVGEEVANGLRTLFGNLRPVKRDDDGLAATAD